MSAKNIIKIIDNKIDNYLKKIIFLALLLLQLIL